MTGSWVEFSVAVVPEVVDDLTAALNKFVGSAFGEDVEFGMRIQTLFR